MTKPIKPPALRCEGFLSLIAAAMLSACAVGPDFVRPAPPEVARYTLAPQAASTVSAAGLVQHFQPNADFPADWWKLFGSEPINAAVQRSLSNSPTLQAAQASLRQSQDNLRAGEGVFFPSISLGIGGMRARSSPVQQGATGAGTIFNVLTANVAISYTLDVFGLERRTVEALAAQVENQRYLTKAAYLTLSANVVNTFVARAAYAAQVRAIEDLIALEREQLHSIEVQARAGTAPYANVLTQRSLIAANLALLAPLRQKLSQSEHFLALLEGVQYHQASIGYLQAIAQRYQDTVALFAALGGGWWNAPDNANQSTQP